jgi:hypothetical protein
MADAATLDDDDAPTQSDDTLKEVHDRAMRRFDDAVLPQLPVREMALVARRFADIPGAMWEGAAGDQFGESIKLEFPKLKRALRKLDNDFRQNRIEPDFRPSGGDSDNETADTLDGLYRADARFFKAQQARDNARAEAAKGGFGAYRLLNDWADPLDKDSDYQRVNPASLIADADQCVFFGPSTLYDKSDAKFAFVLTGWSVEAFKAEYGDDKAVSWPDATSRPWSYDWFRPETIAVCEYYEIEDKDEWVLIFTQETSEEEERHWQKDISAEEIADLRNRGFKQRKRKAKRRRCRKYVMSGAEVLDDCGYIAGGNIPIVPVYGERAYVDGVEWFRGLVQQNMDMVRVFNAVMSSLYEITTLAPYERPIFLAEQMPKNLADMWARGNIDRHPYALVNPVLDPVTGGIAAMGPIGKVETPQVPATLAAMVEMLNGLFAEDDQDPDQVKANTSADAMDIAAARVDAKSGVFLDNDRQSTQRGGELYLAMACEVYVEPGRTVETMTEDGDDGEAVLHEDYSDGGELKVRNNFATGRYKVVADVAETTTTRRDRTVKQMLTFAEVCVSAQDMGTAQAALVTAGMNMDGEGINEFQDWLRTTKALPIGLVKPNEDEKRQAEEASQNQQPDPEQQLVQAQLQLVSAQAQKAMTAAGLDQAKIQEAMASAGLKFAQAQAVGGPEAAPAVPDGLQAANDDAKRVGDLARADLHTAQADKIRAEIPMQRIKTGHQIEMERRAQDQAERTSAA